MVANLPEVGGVIDLLTAQQPPHQIHNVRLEVALVEHGVQHAGTEGPSTSKLRLEQVGQVVRSVGLQRGKLVSFSLYNIFNQLW